MGSTERYQSISGQLHTVVQVAKALMIVKCRESVLVTLFWVP